VSHHYSAIICCKINGKKEETTEFSERIKYSIALYIEL